MNKQDWVWVAIRIFGIYLLVLAVTTIPSLISSVVTLYWTADVSETLNRAAIDGELAGMMRMWAKMWSTRWIDCLGLGIQVALFAAIGLYLLRSGKLLFRWVFPPDATGEQESAAEA